MTLGVILGGGAARRIGGGDKALKPFAGRVLLDAVAERLRPQVTQLALSANGDPSRFSPWRLPVIADDQPDHPGPMAGVLAAMRWASQRLPDVTEIVTAPCDTPFLPRDLVARLRAARAGAEIAVAASGGRSHWVVALWPVAAYSRLSAAFAASGGSRMESLLRAFAVGTAEFPLGACDPFLNINTQEDLAQAEQLHARPDHTGICQTAFQHKVV